MFVFRRTQRTVPYFDLVDNVVMDGQNAAGVTNHITREQMNVLKASSLDPPSVAQGIPMVPHRTDKVTLAMARSTLHEPLPVEEM